MKALPKASDLVKQKWDKANSIVLINESCFLINRQYFIRFQKFVKSSVVDEKNINYIFGTAKKLTSLLTILTKLETICWAQRINPRGSRFGFLYALCITHNKFLEKFAPYKELKLLFTI